MEKAGLPFILENPVLVKIAQKCHKTTAQICLRWALQRKCIVIPKSVHCERIKEDIDVIFRVKLFLEKESFC
jgi:2,5-diketo-D-gluconate reductase A